jgi:hypothetical protein
MLQGVPFSVPSSAIQLEGFNTAHPPPSSHGARVRLCITVRQAGFAFFFFFP